MKRDREAWKEEVWHGQRKNGMDRGRQAWTAEERPRKRESGVDRGRGAQKGKKKCIENKVIMTNVCYFTIRNTKSPEHKQGS